jgi:hypothetical protein
MCFVLLFLKYFKFADLHFFSLLAFKNYNDLIDTCNEILFDELIYEDYILGYQTKKTLKISMSGSSTGSNSEKAADDEDNVEDEDSKDAAEPSFLNTRQMSNFRIHKLMKPDRFNYQRFRVDIKL